MRDDNLCVLTEVLQKSKALEQLFFDENQITLADEKFVDALANNYTLWVLDLDHNMIGAERAKRVAGALRINQTLRKVFLQGNQISDKGAKKLAKTIKCNCSIDKI